MVSLKQIKAALLKLGVEPNKIDDAIVDLGQLLAELDEVEVKGRDNVDTLLGCMMAVEQIIGEDNNG